MIDDALDYRVTEYKILKARPEQYTNHWTKNDLDMNTKFIHAIRKQLKIRRIICSLESYVGGRIRDGDFKLL